MYTSLRVILHFVRFEAGFWGYRGQTERPGIEERIIFPKAGIGLPLRGRYHTVFETCGLHQSASINMMAWGTLRTLGPYITVQFDSGQA